MTLLADRIAGRHYLSAVPHQASLYKRLLNRMSKKKKVG